MPKVPGVRVIQETPEDDIVPVEAELPSSVVGPLYEVFEKEQSSTPFDALNTSNTAISWPSKRTGTVVDLAGTRNGYIDSQRKNNAPYPPAVYLVDGTVENQVDDSYIESIDQTGFELLQGARTGLARGSFSYWALSLNDNQFLYNPNGGLSDIEVGDRTVVGTTNTTVATVTDTKVTVEEDISGDLSSNTRVSQDESNSRDLDITPSATAGRIVASLTDAGNDFTDLVAGISTGDVVVTGVPMTGLMSVQGQVNDSDTSYDEIDELVADSPAGGDSGFGIDIDISEVDNYIVKVVNYDTDDTYTTVDQTYFTTLSAIDTTAGTIGVDDPVGSSDDQYVEVTIMKAQTGYIESINAPANDELTVVVPNTFSDSLTFVDVYTTEDTSDVYPLFDVKVDYRSLRKDLADSAIVVDQESEFLNTVGHASVHKDDGLGFAARVITGAQPNNRSVVFMPVDVEPDGTTGLPENKDLTAGYNNALEALESQSAYNAITLDRSASIDSAVESHVTSMSNEVENAWRRAFFVEEVPLGDTESSTGEIRPGEVSGGVASSATEGNGYIRDANVNFVTNANVVAGTTVVVESPSDLAGEYTALGTTTDDILILEDADWTLTKEFSVSSVDVNTPSADTHVIDGGGITSGDFIHVQAGDYVEVTESGTIYRLPVVSVNSAGTEITCTDEVPGSLDFGTGNSGNGSDLSVIRTWGPSNTPSVEYYIDPLTRQEQVDKLVANQSRSDRRYTVTLDYRPTIQTGTDSSGNPVSEELDPSLTLAAIAAKRSGLRAFDEVTNLVLGGGIESVKWAFGTFKGSQLKQLSDAGYTLVEQRTSSSDPYIRDMITSDTGSIVTQEELVTANGDWMSKTLTNTYVAGPGEQLPILNSRLIGIRTMQIDAILKSWVSEGRLIDFTINGVSQNSTNKRQLDISLTLVMPVAEKEIEFTLELTV